MTDKAFTTLIQEVSANVPGCPQPVMLREIRKSAIRACERTLLWRHVEPTFNLSPGAYEYAYNKPTNSDVHVVFEAMMNGVPCVASGLPGVRQPVTMTGMGEIVPIADAERLAAGGAGTLVGFGRCEARAHRPRSVRGLDRKSYRIAGRRVPTFRAYPSLRARVQGQIANSQEGEERCHERRTPTQRG